MPELIQDEVNGQRIAAEVRKLVAPGTYEASRAALAEVRAQARRPGAAGARREEIMTMVTRMKVLRRLYGYLRPYKAWAVSPSAR